MARLIVQFPDDVEVAVDGAPAGRTNRVIRVDPGEHVIRLLGAESDPTEQTVAAPPSNEVVRVGFAPTERSVDRFSPLYCAYNGFLLGQFLTLSFAEYGRKDYPLRRARMLEFLSEVDVTVDLPEEPFALGSQAQLGLLDTVLPQLAARAHPLVSFTMLGALLTHHGTLAVTDPDTAQEGLEVMEGIRAQFNLPAFDADRFVIDPERRDIDDVLSPSLLYLAEIVGQLAIEPDTAFVIMPFNEPYASYFSTFYRPALEAAGFRAFRAWGGLSSEDYGVLLLKLIEKSGMVWADVSELNANVFYEIGAAHAFGKLSMLVTSEDRVDQTPANIGHDAVMRYSPGDDDWPVGTASLMGMLIASIGLAAEAGERMRVTPDAVGAALEQVGDQFAALLRPPEARDAAIEGRTKLAAHDFEGAAQAFDAAIAFGADDHATRLGRGMSRIGLERYVEAETDFGDVLESPAGELHATAAEYRGMAREFQDDVEGALADYRLAIELGNASAEVYLSTARVLVKRGELKAAENAIEHAREAGAEAAELDAADEEVRAAEDRSA